MKRQGTNTLSKIVIVIATLIFLYFCMLLFFGFPIPRGSKIDSNYYTYYKNIFGIYYISVEHAPALINHGSWGYLDDADMQTFMVLGEGWAKDANHVWHDDEIVKNTDVKSFHINEHGVAMDKNRVYIHDSSNDEDYIRPSYSGIDVETAEYFDLTRKWDLHRIDSLQQPIEAGCQYFRNGRNIIYGDSIILKDIDVQHFEEIGVGKYRVNDMLFLWGKPFLKDSLDVENARFYFHGHIAADNGNVYYVHKLLDDIDASTFRQIDDDTFEDKDYIYTIKENAWKEEYPFDKKKK